MIFIAGVIGCIDGTHVPIVKPSSRDYEEYRCRKSFFSINVQAVVDHDLKFSNIVVRWKGSTHDSGIWNNCCLKAKFEAGLMNGYLLGDNGYACTNFVLTPLLNPVTPAEMRYNEAHIATRNTVERLFGIWKSRFQCLRKCLTFHPNKCCRVILATAVLHNFLRQHKHQDESFAWAANESFFEPDDEREEVTEIMTNKREYVIQTFFSD